MIVRASVEVSLSRDSPTIFVTNDDKESPYGASSLRQVSQWNEMIIPSLVNGIVHEVHRIADKAIYDTRIAFKSFDRCQMQLDMTTMLFCSIHRRKRKAVSMRCDDCWHFLLLFYHCGMHCS